MALPASDHKYNYYFRKMSGDMLLKERVLRLHLKIVTEF